MTAFIAIFAASLVAGEIGPFVSVPGDIPTEIADDSLTPGGAGFYTGVDEIDLPAGGRIYRNGVAVTNVSFPVLFEASAPVYQKADTQGFGWFFDTTGSAIPGERAVENFDLIPARAGQFDLTWYAASNGVPPARYYAYGTNFVAAPLQSTLFLPKSTRLTSDAYAALIATYGAYYERLYFGSQAESNSWDTTVWGRTTAGPEFAWNAGVEPNRFFTIGYPSSPTNYTHGATAQIADTHRLLEHRNITNLNAHVKALFPTETEIGRGLTTRSNAFVSRPGWLLDGTDAPDPYDVQRIWWASTKDPVIQRQRSDMDPSGWYTPDRFELFPKTGDWFPETAFPGRVGAYWPSQNCWPWQCYAVTLDMLKSGHGFVGMGVVSSSPAMRLFEAVGNPYALTVTGYLMAEDVPSFLASNYIECARSRLNYPLNEVGYNAYVRDAWDGPLALGHRIAPFQFVGMNQLLATMDRTIMLPSVAIKSRASIHDVTVSSVHSNATLSTTFIWDEDEACFVAQDGLSGRYALPRRSHSESETLRSVTNEYNCTVIEAAGPGETNPSLGGLVIKAEGVVNGIDWSKALGDIYEACGENQISIVDFGVTVGNIPVATVLYSTSFSPGTLDLRTNSIDLVSAAFTEPSTFSITPVAAFSRSYSYERSNEYPDTVGLAGHLQPGADGSERVKACKVARLMKSFRKPVNFNFYMSNVDDYATSDELRGLIETDFVSDLMDRQLASCSESLGADPTNPEGFAPLPGSVTLNLDGLKEWYPTSVSSDIHAEGWPQFEDYEKERWRCHFPVTNSVWRVEHITGELTEMAGTATTASALVVTEVAPDGWRWTTFAETNLSGVVYSSTNVFDLTGSETTLVDLDFDIASYEIWPYDEPGGPVTWHETTNHVERSTNVVARTVSGMLVQTNITVYTETGLAETNVVRARYSVATTNATGAVARHWEDRADFTEWLSPSRATHVQPFYVAFRVQAEFVNVNFVIGRDGKAEAISSYTVFRDPINHELMPGSPCPLPTAIGTLTVYASPRNAEASLEYVQRQGGHGTYRDEAFFKILTQVDWSWKSIKGN